MNYKKLLLLKVPFNNTYSDIYKFDDVVTSTKEIYNLFKNIDFYPLEITAENNKYFKISNGRVVMPIYRYSYDDIKDYNYLIAIENEDLNDDEIKFYFITGVSSLNDSSTTPSVNIDIEYDCYLNNYFKIKNIEETFTQTYGHCNDIIETNDKIYPKTLSADLDTSNMIETNISVGRKILWLELTLDGEGQWVDNSELHANVELYSVYSLSTQLPIILVPVGVIDTETQKMLPGGSYVLRYNGVEFPITNQSFKIDGVHVVEAKLTYHCPFTYEQVIGSNNQYYFDIKETSVPLKITDALRKAGSEQIARYMPLVSTNITYSATSSVEYTKVISGVKPLGQSQLDSDILYEYAEVQLSSFDKSVYRNKDVFSKELIPQMYTYPYNYVKLYCGNDSTNIIIPENCVKFKVFVKIEGKCKSYYLEYYDSNNAVIKTSLPHPMQSKGFVPVVSDSRDVYLRNQGNSLVVDAQLNEIKYQKNSFQNKLSYVTQSILHPGKANRNKRFNNASNLLSRQIDIEYDYYSSNRSRSAMISDAVAQQDEIINVSGGAIEDVNYQDLIFIRECHIDTDSLNYLSNVLNIYKFGVPCNVSTKLLDNIRRLFTYRKLSDCKITSITNIDERLIVESIFTNGVTIWNFTSMPNNSYKNALTSMQKTMNNPIT